MDDFEAVLSAPRFATYLQATRGNRERAVALYCWNTEVSTALYTLLQFCEVAVRNGAVEALEAEFTHNWHLNRGFIHTLVVLRGRRGSGSRYQPKADLQVCASKFLTAGKVVAELKFVFWQYLFVKGQDKRLWLPHFADVFPGYDESLSIPEARSHMHWTLEHVRDLRNRIAHHEPIFRRDLAKDRDLVLQLIHWRRPSVAQWLRTAEGISNLLTIRP